MSGERVSHICPPLSEGGNSIMFDVWIYDCHEVPPTSHSAPWTRVISAPSACCCPWRTTSAPGPPSLSFWAETPPGVTLESCRHTHTRPLPPVWRRIAMRVTAAYCDAHCVFKAPCWLIGSRLHVRRNDAKLTSSQTRHELIWT